LGEDDVATRLAAIGFVDVDIEVGDFEIRFSATKPTAS
jgi:hypothetical protein